MLGHIKTLPTWPLFAKPKGLQIILNMNDLEIVNPPCSNTNDLEIVNPLCSNTNDLEIVNPLCSNAEKHKLTVFYFTLGNITPQFRSKLQAIQLLAICKSKYIYGHAQGERISLNDFFSFTNDMTGGVPMVINGENNSLRYFNWLLLQVIHLRLSG